MLIILVLEPKSQFGHWVAHSGADTFYRFVQDVKTLFITFVSVKNRKKI